MASDFSIRNSISIRNTAEFFCSPRKIMYIMTKKYLCDKKEINLDTEDMQIDLHIFLLSCFYFAARFCSCIQILISYPFSSIISASLNVLVKARSLAIWKAMHCVNQEHGSLGHTGPEIIPRREKMGTIFQTRECVQAVARGGSDVVTGVLPSL